ncbi:MAG: hypothetical protein OEU54_05760 [Gemmatimonadota bacterium]|nr:hypothetical protein [Gemmatimonadota bacterium]
MSASHAGTPLRSAPALAHGARFLASLPPYLRKRIDVASARALHERALATRENRFFEMVGAAAFDRPQSLLGRLFRHAGVGRGELHGLVEREGLEGALKALFRAGVYITVDEFKGRAPLVRGSLSLDATPESLRNPLARFHVAAQSGGSRSKAPPFLIDLAYVRASANAFLLHLDANGLASSRKATWESPGAGCRFRLLKYACFGPRPDAWFTPVDPRDPDLDPIFLWSQRAMRAGGFIARAPLPSATIATRDDPSPILAWIQSCLMAGEVPHVHTQPTALVALAIAARKAGADLTGAFGTTLGEPTTVARLATIESCGLKAFPRYGTIEAGPIGYGCRNPTEVDEVHFIRDLHAFIQPGENGPDVGLPPRSILLTALHTAAPYTMLNFSMGDEAIVDESDCGCALSSLGWNPRLRHIRSFEKFTAAGITFDDTEVVRLLEEVLPRRFGGGPADFQLVEDENDQGEPVLILRVHPRVDDLEESALGEAFFSVLGEGSPIAQVMQRALHGSVTLEVERGPPHMTRSGKFTHLHIRTREHA